MIYLICLQVDDGILSKIKMNLVRHRVYSFGPVNDDMVNLDRGNFSFLCSQLSLNEVWIVKIFRQI